MLNEKLRSNLNYHKKQYGMIEINEKKTNELIKKLFELDINNLEVIHVNHIKNENYNNFKKMNWLINFQPDIISVKKDSIFDIFNMLFVFNNRFFILDKSIFLYILHKSIFIDKILFNDFKSCYNQIGLNQGKNYKTWLLYESNIEIKEKLNMESYFYDFKQKRKIILKNKKMKI